MRFSDRNYIYLIAISVIICALGVFSCKTYTDPLLYGTYETRAISPEGYGNYILRVQGKGTSKKMAIENAKKQAVRDVLFTDVHVAYGDHKPLMRLIVDPSIEQKNAAFFKDFFSSNGTYKNYISSTKEDRESYSKGANYTVILNIIVKRDELRQLLMNQGLIK